MQQELPSRTEVEMFRTEVDPDLIIFIATDYEMKAVLERFQQDLNAKHGTSTGMSRLPDEWEGKKVLPIIKSDSSRLEDTYYCKTLDYAPSNMDEEHEEGCYMRIMIVPCGAGSLDASAAVEQVLQYVKPNEPQAVIMIGMGAGIGPSVQLKDGGQNEEGQHGGWIDFTREMQTPQVVMATSASCPMERAKLVCESGIRNAKLQPDLNPYNEYHAPQGEGLWHSLPEEQRPYKGHFYTTPLLWKCDRGDADNWIPMVHPKEWNSEKLKLNNANKEKFNNAVVEMEVAPLYRILKHYNIKKYVAFKGIADNGDARKAGNGKREMQEAVTGKACDLVLHQIIDKNIWRLQLRPKDSTAPRFNAYEPVMSFPKQSERFTKELNLPSLPWCNKEATVKVDFYSLSPCHHRARISIEAEPVDRVMCVQVELYDEQKCCAIYTTEPLDQSKPTNIYRDVCFHCDSKPGDIHVEPTVVLTQHDPGLASPSSSSY